MRSIRWAVTMGMVVGLLWMPSTTKAGWSAPAPSISLTKTVGTDPGACATSDAITVTAGTAVTYCYRMQNDAGVTLTTHSLFDDQLGTLLNESFDTVAPGASAVLTATATIHATTLNVATWSASTGLPMNGSAHTLTPLFIASDSATVTALIPPTETGGGGGLDGCSDGIDNDDDNAIDCADSDCVNVNPCVAAAPTLGPAGLVAAGLLLLSIGASSLLTRRRS